LGQCFGSQVLLGGKGYGIILTVSCFDLAEIAILDSKKNELTYDIYTGVNNSGIREGGVLEIYCSFLQNTVYWLVRAQLNFAKEE